MTRKKGNGFSTGEGDLYRNHATIQKRMKGEREAEMEATRKFFEAKTYDNFIPVPSKK